MRNILDTMIVGYLLTEYDVYGRGKDESYMCKYCMDDAKTVVGIDAFKSVNPKPITEQERWALGVTCTECTTRAPSIEPVVLTPIAWDNLEEEGTAERTRSLTAQIRWALYRLGQHHQGHQLNFLLAQILEYAKANLSDDAMYEFCVDTLLPPARDRLVEHHAIIEEGYGKNFLSIPCTRIRIPLKELRGEEETPLGYTALYFVGEDNERPVCFGTIDPDGMHDLDVCFVARPAWYICKFSREWDVVVNDHYYVLCGATAAEARQVYDEQVAGGSSHFVELCYNDVPVLTHGELPPD